MVVVKHYFEGGSTSEKVGSLEEANSMAEYIMDDYSEKIDIFVDGTQVY